MMRKALAVLLACGAILAAAAPAFAWPDSVEGQPSLTDSSATGYFLWHADDGFHLRTHGPGAEHLFTASLRTGGVFTSVDPIRLEPGDRADIVDGGHGLVLRFHTFDGIDGVDFRVDGGQRQRLRLALDLDGQLIATDAIHLGPDGTHPATNPFTLYR